MTAIAPKPQEYGFTLIELMIVVVIIGILAAIALPNYNQYVTRSKLVEATTNLSDQRVKMEQFYQDNRNYGNANGTNCSVDSGGTAKVSFTLNAKYFTYSCTVTNSQQGYTITASSVAGTGLGAAGDYQYTINESNAKGTLSFKGAASTKTCWLITGAEC